ncbi:hypothetical protein D7030_09800 [Flavobacteriaceae bacterium AU392]|nr:hypothetical protein D1817_07010 [Flavobacteriaceae bacterium]RKM83580.1 hypothetical protein D7030_09800 [Flavobacteriaceae bacterium AU392]
MSIIQKIKSFNEYEILLVLSFVLIIIKSMEYLFIGIFYPLIIIILLLSPFIYIAFGAKCNFQKALKYWSILIICYGTIRVLLHVLTFIESKGIPSAAYYQFTLWYGLKSMIYIVLGSVLLLKRKYITY